MHAKPLLVTPVYCWGWVAADKQETITVPAPFFLAVASVERTPRFAATGVASQTGQLLDGLRVTLLQRHANWDGQCNLTAFGPNGAARYHGFAQINLDEA
ncbi:MAG: hypothetical protein AB7J28_06670 [Hyphomonadaceae bacterium]